MGLREFYLFIYFFRQMGLGLWGLQENGSFGLLRVCLCVLFTVVHITFNKYFLLSFLLHLMSPRLPFHMAVEDHFPFVRYFIQKSSKPISLFIFLIILSS
jgi:hypothetical protein